MILYSRISLVFQNEFSSNGRSGLMLLLSPFHIGQESVCTQWPVAASGGPITIWTFPPILYLPHIWQYIECCKYISPGIFTWVHLQYFLHCGKNFKIRWNVRKYIKTSHWLTRSMKLSMWKRNLGQSNVKCVESKVLIKVRITEHLHKKN